MSFKESSARDKITEVIVLSTLHQLHAKSEFYSYVILAQIIEQLSPDILAVELTPADLKSRKEQRIKQEYAQCIFPLADKRDYLLIPLEPPEPKYSQLVQLMRDAEKELQERSPQKAEAFDIFAEALYDTLFKTWNSPLSVCLPQTDALFEVKHKYQSALYGAKEEQGWEGWNQHFLEKVREAAREHAGKRIVIIVGAEHGYWLRKRLQEETSMTLLKIEGMLK